MKIYNKRAITRQQRFNNALVAGILASVAVTLAYGLLSSVLRIEFSVVYLGIGYFIGETIKKYGRGVQVQFSILAAVLVAVSFVIGDMIAIFGFDILVQPSSWLVGIQIVFTRLLSTNMNALLSLLFRVGGVYLAYTNARI